MNVSNHWNNENPKNLENAKNLKPENRISTKSCYKLFSVVHHYLLWMFLIIERKYVDRIPSKCPQKLRKCAKNEKLKMRISTKPFYKLFSVVHSYFQWMFLVIDRIYDDRIPAKCPQKLRKCAKNEKLKMPISTKPFYETFQCGPQKLSMNVSNQWKDIWWSYPSKMFPKT